MNNGRNSEGYPDPTQCEAERNIEYERRQQGRRAKYAGERFENMISAACNYYRSQNIADIEKTPEPMRPLKPYGDRRRGQYVAVFTKKAQNDYKGILNGGRCVAFEAKHTDADKIEASAVSDRQAELLENYEKMGASCFVLVSFKFEQFYRIPWSVWRDMKDIYGHKHLKRSEIQDYEIGLNHLGTLEFLKRQREERTMLTRALNDLKNPKSKTGSLQIIATFTGTTGSMGFITGQRYELIVRYIRSRGHFEVKTRDGQLFCPYQSTEAFAKNWSASAIQKGA